MYEDGFFAVPAEHMEGGGGGGGGGTGDADQLREDLISGAVTVKYAEIAEVAENVVGGGSSQIAEYALKLGNPAEDAPVPYWVQAYDVVTINKNNNIFNLCNKAYYESVDPIVTYAKTCGEAYSVVGTVDHAALADRATLADNATNAFQASNATHATDSNTADYATTAGSASTAGYASTAGTATTAESATNANFANTATAATNATNAANLFVAPSTTIPANTVITTSNIGNYLTNNTRNVTLLLPNANTYTLTGTYANSFLWLAMHTANAIFDLTPDNSDFGLATFQTSPDIDVFNGTDYTVTILATGGGIYTTNLVSRGNWKTIQPWGSVTVKRLLKDNNNLTILLVGALQSP